MYTVINKAHLCHYAGVWQVCEPSRHQCPMHEQHSHQVACDGRRLQRRTNDVCHGDETRAQTDATATDRR